MYDLSAEFFIFAPKSTATHACQLLPAAADVTVDLMHVYIAHEEK